MLWTWDRYGVDAGKWRRNAEVSRPPTERDPFAHFLTSIDVALYVAIAAFVACIATIALP